jgi:hypothetical protein
MLELEKQRDHGISDTDDREIYPKDPPPRNYEVDDKHTFHHIDSRGRTILRKCASDDRSRDGANGIHSAHKTTPKFSNYRRFVGGKEVLPKPLPPFSQRDHISDNHLRQRNHTSCPDTLQTSPNQHDREVLRDRRNDSTD